MNKILKAISLFNSSVFSRDERKQYESRFTLLSLISRKFGFYLYNKNLFWYSDRDFEQSWGEFPEYNINRVKDRRYVLYSMAKSLVSLPGDTAECGTFNGATSFLICLAHQEKINYCHHIFDSFKGLSEPEDKDIPKDITAFKWKKHDLSCSLDRVKKNLDKFDFVHYHPGWIPEKFEEVSDRNFSFVHIDVDLYQPTRHSLEFFYPRMVSGGIILCDDYGFTSCPGAKEAFDSFIKDKPEQRVIHLTSGQGFIVKR
jgi:O-methyltransferase